MDCNANSEQEIAVGTQEKGTGNYRIKVKLSNPLFHCKNGDKWSHLSMNYSFG